MLHFEDSVNKKPLYFYDKKAEFIDSVPNPVNGGVTEIKYGDAKALTNELKYFISKLNGQKVEISNGISGLEVVKILENASQSL